MSMVVCKILLCIFFVFINSSKCYSHIFPGIYLTFLQNVLDQAWAPIVINSHILAGIYSVFLKNVLDQTWILLKPNLDLSENIGKSYQVRQNLSLFCSLIPLILGW